MKRSRNSLPVLLVPMLLLVGCVSAPGPNTDAQPSARPDAQPSARPAAPKQLTAPSQPRQAEPEAASEGMTIFELQDRLTALGYKLGAIDGVFGPRTVEALKKFQGDSKLPVSGTIDAATIGKLRSAKP